MFRCESPGALKIQTRLCATTLWSDKALQLVLPAEVTTYTLQPYWRNRCNTDHPVRGYLRMASFGCESMLGQLCYVDSEAVLESRVGVFRGIAASPA